MRCPRCGSDNPPGASFCGRCGAGLQRTCPSCGSLNPEGFAFCGTCGTRLTGPEHPAVIPVEERKVVTVLFADITDSTPLAERLDPEQTRAIVGRFFGAMAAVIAQYGGTVEKFIGDEIMAVFGLPAAHEFSSLTGEWDYTNRLGDEILQMSRTSGARFHLARNCRSMATHLRETGRHDEADVLLLEAQELFRAMDCRYELGRTLHELAELRRARGRNSEAATLLQEALTLFEALGAMPDIERTQALM